MIKWLVIASIVTIWGWIGFLSGTMYSKDKARHEYQAKVKSLENDNRKLSAEIGFHQRFYKKYFSCEEE